MVTFITLYQWEYKEITSLYYTFKEVCTIVGVIYGINSKSVSVSVLCGRRMQLSQEYVLTRCTAGGAQEGKSAWAVGVQELHGGGRGTELVLE